MEATIDLAFVEVTIYGFLVRMRANTVLSQGSYSFIHAYCCDTIDSVSSTGKHGQN
jgi:hypothetical protein